MGRMTAGPGAWFVGVDAASSKAAVAAINETTGEIRHTAIHVKGREFARRYVDLRIAIRLFLTPIADDGAWCAVVERPNTRLGGSVLGGAYGVACEAVASIIPGAALHTLGPQEIDPLAGVKQQRGSDRKAFTRARAMTLGYTGDSQDVCDALVCAAAARTLTSQNTRSVA